MAGKSTLGLFFLFCFYPVGFFFFLFFPVPQFVRF